LNNLTIDDILKTDKLKKLPQVDVPKEEYARVSTAVNSINYPKDYQNGECIILHLSNGYKYLIQKGKYDFKIKGRTFIDGTGLYDR